MFFLRIERAVTGAAKTEGGLRSVRTHGIDMIIYLSQYRTAPGRVMEHSEVRCTITPAQGAAAYRLRNQAYSASGNESTVDDKVDALIGRIRSLANNTWANRAR
jgi:hypothetical protein